MRTCLDSVALLWMTGKGSNHVFGASVSFQGIKTEDSLNHSPSQSGFLSYGPSFSTAPAGQSPYAYPVHSECGVPPSAFLPLSGALQGGCPSFIHPLIRLPKCLLCARLQLKCWTKCEFCPGSNPTVPGRDGNTHASR